MQRKIKLFFLLFFLLTGKVLASELPMIAIGSSSALQGETVTIPITITNNPGIHSLGMKIRYDEEIIKYKEGEITSLANADMKGLEENSSHTITLYAISLSEEKKITDNETIASLTFEVLAPSGKSNLELEVTNFSDLNHQKKLFDTTSGLISVKEKVTIGTSMFPSPLESEEETYFSSNEEVAKIDEQGHITFEKPGEVTIGKKNQEEIIEEMEYVVLNPETETKKNKSWMLIILLILLIFSIFIMRKQYQKILVRKNA